VTLYGAWPMIAPERWLADFENIGIKDENRPLILKQDAARLLASSHPNSREP